jgi:hypothetical protein
LERIEEEAIVNFKVLIMLRFARLDIFTAINGSRLVQGHTQPPIHWVLTAPSLRIKRGNEADHSPPVSAKVKGVWSCASIPEYAFME